MHIPSSSTNELEIISFKDALEAYETASGLNYQREKWLYVPHQYAEYRYILAKRGPKPLICVGINPSTAAPDNLDNTLKSLDRIAAANGFDGWIMFNVYAQRATRPKDMDDSLNADLNRENIAAFEYALTRSERPIVWAAWGNVIEERPYLMTCLEDMIALAKTHGATWVCAGPISKRGHPHHPLYLKKDTPLTPFDIIDYCAHFQLAPGA